MKRKPAKARKNAGEPVILMGPTGAPAETPATPIHNEEPGRPLPAFMDFLYDEFGEATRTEIVARMQRFHLPFTSEKIAPKPAAQEIADWVGEIASLSNAAPAAEQPDVSIIIPVYNQLAFTLACIHSVLSSKSRYSYEILVADDRSTDRTTELFSQGLGRILHVSGNRTKDLFETATTPPSTSRAAISSCSTTTPSCYQDGWMS